MGEIRKEKESRGYPSLQVHSSACVSDRKVLLNLHTQGILSLTQHVQQTMFSVISNTKKLKCIHFNQVYLVHSSQIFKHKALEF